MAAQVLWALGYTFTSGASQAWISNEIGDENAGLAFIRGARWDQWGELLARLQVFYRHPLPQSSHPDWRGTFHCSGDLPYIFHARKWIPAGCH